MESPQLFGSYLLHKRLAISETSEVFIAQTLGEFARLCVIKRIRPDLSTLPDFYQRFRDDAALLIRLIHGNVAQVLEVGSVDNQPFIAMEHIDGVCLRDLVGDVATKGQIPAEVALYIGLELCEAVSYIFLRRREHGGVGAFGHTHAWPLDAMVSFDGVVKVISPGSVGALRLGQRSVFKVLRSPGYAPPEVLLRHDSDARSDVFSLGTILWELLSGRPLISRDPEGYTKEVLEGRFEAPLITRKDVPGEVIRTVANMLQLDPDKRPVAPEAVRATLVSGLRRMAPTFGSGAMARVLLGRYAQQIGTAEQMTDALARKAVTLRSSFQPGSASTLTYGRPEDLELDVSQEIAPFKPGDQIPGTRYRMIRLLGRGGGAEVLAAQHIDLDRRVAIKVLAPELATQAAAIAHFRLEARTCSRIGHPNIIDVTDFGELPDGRFFFAMELLEGKNLGEILTERHKLTPERAIPIFRQIAKALQAAHEHGVVHRDLKPENVMVVERDGRSDFVKVLDFGVMAFSAEQSVERVGTPGYMAPEQIERERLTPRTDIYGVGVGLYEVLCGELPYGGETIDAYGEEVRSGPAPALRSKRGANKIHPAIERVVHRALERDPELRHPSAADFEMDLLRAQREAEITTDWDDLPEPEVLRDRRRCATARHTAIDDDVPRKPLVSRIALLAFVAVIAMGLYILLSTRGAVAPPVASDTMVEARPSDPDTRIQRVAPPVRRSPPSAAPPSSPTQPVTLDPVEASHPQTPPVPRTGRPTASARKLSAEGRRLLRERKLFEASEKFEAALAKNPKSRAALRGLAGVAFQRARYDEALTHARRAVALDDKDVRALMLMGDCYAKLLRRNEARQAWERVLRLDPNNRVAAARLERSGSP